jgi:putative monooxygenase
MSTKDNPKISTEDVEPITRRGGELRPLLTPTTVGSSTGFMGVATLAPAEVITEHYHPYSEEFLYVSAGELVLYLDGEREEMEAGQALLVRKGVRHRLENEGSEPVHVVFHLSPLAPRPELGHVDTEASL